MGFKTLAGINVGLEKKIEVKGGIVDLHPPVGAADSNAFACDMSVMETIAALFQTEAEREVLHIQRRIAEFGQWMRKRRIEAGLSQDELAKLAQTSRTTVANIEAGLMSGGPRLGTAIKLLRVCGKSLEFHTGDMSEEEASVLRAKRVAAGGPAQLGGHPVNVANEKVVCLTEKKGRQENACDNSHRLSCSDGGVGTSGGSHSGVE